MILLVTRLFLSGSVSNQIQKELFQYIFNRVTKIEQLLYHNRKEKKQIEQDKIPQNHLTNFMRIEMKLAADQLAEKQTSDAVTYRIFPTLIVRLHEL